MKRGGRLRRKTPLRPVRTVRRQPTVARSAPAPDPIAASRPVVFERAQGRCERCGARRPEHAHHRQKRRFGRHGPENLAALCRHCHTAVHDQPDEKSRALAQGFVVYAFVDPAEQPMARWDGTFLLFNDGTMREVEF